MLSAATCCRNVAASIALCKTRSSAINPRKPAIIATPFRDCPVVGTVPAYGAGINNHSALRGAFRQEPTYSFHKEGNVTRRNDLSLGFVLNRPGDGGRTMCR